MASSRQSKTLLEVFYPTRSEYEEQVAVFEWAAMAAKTTYPELEMLIGSLNGVRISIGAAVKAKRAGLKDGYPDLSLDCRRSTGLGPPREFYGGLRIELKRIGNGKITPRQVWWLDRLREQGFRAVVCWGADEAINEIESYLELPRS
jgi:hypothetical protein